MWSKYWLFCAYHHMHMHTPSHAKIPAHLYTYIHPHNHAHTLTCPKLPFARFTNSVVASMLILYNAHKEVLFRWSQTFNYLKNCWKIHKEDMTATSQSTHLRESRGQLSIQSDAVHDIQSTEPVVHDLLACNRWQWPTYYNTKNAVCSMHMYVNTYMHALSIHNFTIGI